MPVRWDTTEVSGKEMRIYIGVPESEPKRRGILVAQHGGGVDGFVQDVVNRLFRRGYVAAAPELYHRQPSDINDNMARIGMLKDDEIIADMNATLAHMKSLKEPTVGHVGIVGFCMGGRVSYLMAAANSEIKACTVFYGGNILKPWGGSPTPFERTKDIRCPMIGFFGAEDTNPSPEDVKKIDAEMTRHGKPHEFHTYHGAGHAFQNFLDAARYRERPARGTWTEMLAFFSQHLRP
ncbi:MAG: dienelactone hydrolase family protein [Betaproteobacteria bacterium]|nr:dienelactone hydrolase family protein [Betaproteobacteria bacterium]MDH3436162.1 dienelactone hydrolase family protein [Betaproteobacteria bacterium]